MVARIQSLELSPFERFPEVLGFGIGATATFKRTLISGQSLWGKTSEGIYVCTVHYIYLTIAQI
jgi:hypothetical protein